MTRPLKIAITGANFTGKTTTVNALAERFNDRSVKIIPEFAQYYAQRHHATNLKMDGESISTSTLMAMAHYPGRELAEMMTKPDLVICDRGIVDSFITMLSMGIKYNEAELTYLEGLFSTHAKTYDMVAYHPIEFDLQKKGFGGRNTKARHRMDEIIRNAWKGAGVDLFEVSGSVTERVELISHALDLKYDFA